MPRGLASQHQAPDGCRLDRMPEARPVSVMPPLLYGTAWKKDDTARLVHSALSAGFRGIDTACQPKHYNEAGVGMGLTRFLSEGHVTRAELYVQTKFTPVDGHDPRRIPYDKELPLREQVRASCAVSLRNLGLDVLDALILHSPLRTFEQTLEVWSAFEELVDEGVVRRLGLSNCYKVSFVRALWERVSVKPSLLQNRFYADTGYDVMLRAFCQQVNLEYQSFWTLTANPHVLQSNAVVEAARRLGFTEAQVFYRCLTQIGIVPLIGTTSSVHMAQDVAIFERELRKSEVDDIVALLR